MHTTAIRLPRNPAVAFVPFRLSIFDTFVVEVSARCTRKSPPRTRLLQRPNEQSIRGAALGNHYPNVSNLYECPFLVAFVPRLVRWLGTFG